MRTLWVSVRQMKLHEFHTTLRHIKTTGTSWHDIYCRLSDIQNSAAERLMKQAVLPLFFYFLLSTFENGHWVSVSYRGTTAAIPAALVALTASVTYFFLCLSIQHLLMIMIFKAKETSRLVLNGFNSGAYGLYHQKDEMPLISPIILNGFMRPKKAIPTILLYISSITIGFLLVPVLAFGVFLFKKQAELLRIENAPFISDAASVAGLAVIIATMMYVALFNIPIRFDRASYSIRWGFLSKMYPLGEHPRIGEWLDDSSVNNSGR